MIHIPTLLEFWQRTAPLVDYEFEDVDIVPDTIIGDFNAYRLEDLPEFCLYNPDSISFIFSKTSSLSTK